MKTLCIGHAWLEAAQRIASHEHSDFLCIVVHRMASAGDISAATECAMIARIRDDISARLGRELGTFETVVAYVDDSSTVIDATGAERNVDDDMSYDDERDARVLAALMFAHEAMDA